MKMRFIESFIGFPRVEIMPNWGNFDATEGRIEVSFFEMDIDTGKGIYQPMIYSNVSFGDKMTPMAADEWGECFKAAHLISQRGIPTYNIDHAGVDQIVNAFERVNELLGSKKG